MIPQYQRTLTRCDELLKRAGNTPLDETLISAVCQHICILLAGALESAFREILTGYCSATSSPRIAAFATKRISSFKNADPEKISELVRQFDSKWADEIDAFWKDEIKDHIGSIVGNRHLIAHGRPTEVSIARLREWRKSVQKLLDKLIEITTR